MQPFFSRLGTAEMFLFLFLIYKYITNGHIVANKIVLKSFLTSLFDIENMKWERVPTGGLKHEELETLSWQKTKWAREAKKNHNSFFFTEEILRNMSQG